MTSKNTQLVTQTQDALAHYKTEAALAKRMSNHEDELKDQAQSIRTAIDADKLQIEQSLNLLQHEFDRYSDKVEHVVDESKQRIDRAKAKVEKLKDWKVWVAQNPWKTVGIGLAAGFYLGGVHGA